MAYSKAEPTVFGSIVGLFTPVPDGQPRRNIAVLFLSPWGMEELCTRKYYRILAEQFASVGVASLRFDFPGTANAVDPTPENVGLGGWFGAMRSATRELKELSGAQNVVFLGHGVGGSLAFLEAPTTDDLAGLILMAPVVKGRSYLRELSLLSKFIDSTMAVKEDLRDNTPGSIAGLRMPPEIAAQIKDINLEKAPQPAPRLPVLMVSRSSDDSNLAACLKDAGCTVDTITYDGYDHLINSPLSQQFPNDMGDKLCAWLATLPAYQAIADAASRQPLARPIAFGSARETPVRFGKSDNLFGTLCEPVGNSIGVAALILTTGYDPQSGWARSTVELARRLAAVGIVSLRYDSADVGDSPPEPGRRKQILYDAEQNSDVGLAYDFLQQQSLASKSMIIGRCSGAFVAFRSAVCDPRWDACVAVNSPAFRWRFKGLPRTLSAYLAKLRSSGVTRKFLAGETDAYAALHNVVIRLVDRAAVAAARVFPTATRLAHRSRLVLNDFETLARRNAKVSLVYSEGDEGKDDFHIHFGWSGENLAMFPNVEFHMIQDADHNLTPRHAREMVFEVIERQALSLARG